MNDDHAELLGTLARAAPEALKEFGDGLIPRLGEIEVLASRSGLVMLPMRDTAQGAAFHLGEVLVAEAHIRRGEAEGYGMRTGRDLEAAMAMALVDLALAEGIEAEACREFCAAQKAAQEAEDEARLRDIAATAVDMETF